MTSWDHDSLPLFSTPGKVLNYPTSMASRYRLRTPCWLAEHRGRLAFLNWSSLIVLRVVCLVMIIMVRRLPLTVRAMITKALMNQTTEEALRKRTREKKTALLPSHLFFLCSEPRMRLVDNPPGPAYVAPAWNVFEHMHEPCTIR